MQNASSKISARIAKLSERLKRSNDTNFIKDGMIAMMPGTGGSATPAPVAAVPKANPVAATPAPAPVVAPTVPTAAPAPTISSPIDLALGSLNLGSAGGGVPAPAPTSSTDRKSVV